MSVISKAGSGFAILAASALVLSGCSASGVASYADVCAPDEEAAGIQLKVGTALPVTGALAFLGPPEVAASLLAKCDINNANLGIQIEVIQGDSGDPDNKAYETEIPRLLAADVSAVVGAASSAVSLNFIDQLVFEAEVIQYSPANTSPEFTVKDTNGLYFRAAPSDALQGQVIGDELLADGYEAISMIVLNDAYGNGLADAIEARFVAGGGTVLEKPTYNSGETNFSSQIATIVGSNPDAVVVITFDEAVTMLPDLLNAFSGDQLFFVDGNMADYSDAGLAAGALEGAKGTAPGSKEQPTELISRSDALWQEVGNDPLDSNLYLGETYDTVISIALAALMAKSTVARDIANQLPAVTGANGGDLCFSFAECAEKINAGASAISFSGATGPMGFDANGDRTTAVINMFQYGADNKIGADPIRQTEFGN
jgi:branched-chain amino acid transport system substrate-binding protein